MTQGHWAEEAVPRTHFRALRTITCFISAGGSEGATAWGTGGRSRPFSTSVDVNPLTYANLGSVISSPEVHADGEIWVEALMEIRANLIAQFGPPLLNMRVVWAIKVISMMPP